MIVGIDYSIRSPAVTIEKGGHYWCFFRSPIKRHIVDAGFVFHGIEDLTSKQSGPKRYADLAYWTKQCVYFCLPNPEKILIGFERASYGSPGRIVQLAENAGAAKAALCDFHADIVDVSPQTIKKYATGSGRAEKVDMYNKFVEKTSIQLTKYFDCGSEGNPISDIVDSYWITQYLLHNSESITKSLEVNGSKIHKKTKRRGKKAKSRYA